MKCSMCNKTIEKNIFNLFNISNELCLNCLYNLEMLGYNGYITVQIKGIKKVYPLIVLYKYNEFAKEIMYKYKEQGDIKISNMLSTIIEGYLKINNVKDYKYMPVSSSTESKERRGFYTNEEILKKVSRSKMIKGPKRVDNQKQGKKSLYDRKKVKHLYEKVTIKDNIIIFDDVIVSGETIKQFISNINNPNNKKITIVILFGGQKFLDN